MATCNFNTPSQAAGWLTPWSRMLHQARLPATTMTTARVDAADYVVWRDTLGSTTCWPPTATRMATSINTTTRFGGGHSATWRPGQHTQLPRVPEPVSAAFAHDRQLVLIYARISGNARSIDLKRIIHIILVPSYQRVENHYDECQQIAESRLQQSTAMLLSRPVFPAGAAQALDATAVVQGDEDGGKISRHIYGHFAEHLGRCIYDGIWVGEDSPIPNTRGIRNDIIDALKNLDIPNLRWPGGCYADDYHWRDGIGPRDKRPHRVNIHWGQVIDTNAFGTHEFLDLCELIGAEPYIAGNVGSGTPQELRDWIEYMTFDGDSELANLRRKNGREKPWKVRYVGVGNENWGCGGEHGAGVLLRPVPPLRHLLPRSSATTGWSASPAAPAASTAIMPAS